MDKFFRSFLEMKWKIKGEWVSFLDALLFVAITGSSLIMRLALMWGFTGWFWLVDYVAAAAASILQLLRLILLFGGRDRRD